MILNTETVLNDSKKISELRKRTEITKHQENSWIPMAQYNSRTNSYVNFAMNLEAITSYTNSYALSYVASEFGDEWINLLATGKQIKYDNLGESIQNSSIAKNLLSYTFTYTTQYFDWQIVDGSFIPDYWVPNHPDKADEPRQPMPNPVGDNPNYFPGGYMDVTFGKPKIEVQIGGYFEVEFGIV